MPLAGPIKELSVGQVAQIQHRRNVIMISVLMFVFLGAFFFSLRDFSAAYAVGVIFLLGFFLISFINIRIGFILVVLSFLLSPELHLPFSQIKGFILRIDDLLIVVLVLAWLGRLAMGLQKTITTRTPLSLPIALIIAWNIISSFRAISFGMIDANYCILVNLKIIEYFMIYFLLVNNLQDIREAKFILYVLLIVALIIGIYAAFQIPKTRMWSSNRLSAPFEGRPEPNTLGAYLAIFFGIALSIFIYEKKSLLKKLCVALLVLLPFPIMFSFSRSVYIATIAMVVVMAIISKRKWLFFAIAAFFILSPFILPHAVIDRALYNFKDPRYFGILDPSSAERVVVYKKVWYNFKLHPILGGGIGMMGGVLDSQYARVIMETGLIGIILFLWLLFRLLKTGIKLFKNTAEGWVKGMGAGFSIAVIGLTLHCWGNITFYIVRIAEPFWALAALIAFFLQYTDAQRNKALLPQVEKVNKT